MIIFISAQVAQRVNNPVLGNLGNLSGAEFLGRLLPALLTLGFVIGSIIFIFYFLTGAVKWISSGGDKVKVQEAQSQITNALVGLLILFALFAIISLIEIFFGVDLTLFNLEQLRVAGGGGTPGPGPCPLCAPGVPCCAPGVCVGSVCAI